MELPKILDAEKTLDTMLAVAKALSLEDYVESASTPAMLEKDPRRAKLIAAAKHMLEAVKVGA